MVWDIDQSVVQPLINAGASCADSPKIMAEQRDIMITCLPSPAASVAVMEAEDGVLPRLSAGKIWAEMSTTDAAEATRLGTLVRARGVDPVDCPVSGGVIAPPLAILLFLLDVTDHCLRKCCRF